jgi:hypothetical protein
VGREAEFILAHPEYVLFMDEVGNNASQKSDINVGGPPPTSLLHSAM